VTALVLNLVLMAFNLLVPAYPLDGGRLLANGLLACGVEPTLAAKIIVGVAVPLAVGIVLWGAHCC
jgi:Zn-dependent protease